MASRKDVYAAIDGEREYQEGWKDPTLTTSQGRHTNQEFLTYIRSYVNEALEIGARRPDPVADPIIRHSMRKIAALAVAAMEMNGVEERNPADSLRQRHP